MIRQHCKPIFLAIALIACTQSLIAQNDPKEIIRKAEDKLKGTTSQAEMTMTVVRPKWDRTISLKTWSKGQELAMILITGPARDKGTAFLKKGKEVWNWQPTIERIIKLPPSMMMQSWMGSDFTNDDLVKESSTIHDYNHALGKDTVIADRKCWTIVLTPKEDAPVVWGKVVMWVDQKDYMQMRAAFYDEDGFLVNTMQASDIGDLGGKVLPRTMEMTPVDKPGNKTIIHYQSLVFDQPIDDNFFTVGQLKSLR
ncbi:MAG: outer membrane lipoprotein-sorting protein [Flavobacteriales bacterium]|nr:outer membrane lipoprotein-sorting protein [Flavobacteriales bacterium]MCB9447497.1 outer membrane lipoprotein-sorting protein [Flavobacteriales bacterium]